MKQIIYFLILFSIILNVAKTNDLDHTTIYNNIKKSLNSKKPGFGPSDYGLQEIADIPKAYAMLLSSELMQYEKNLNDYNLSMAINAGKWLLSNNDLNNNGVVGWGVPIAWDAFGDNSINEKNAEYTISTGIVINSLMDWIEKSPSTAPKEKILNIIKKAINPYLQENIFSSSGLYNYSLKKVDRKFNCFNAAAYMAGQMQRFTKFISDKDLKNQIKLSVDRVMSSMLQYKKIDKKGGWYWTYSIEQKDTPNDLAHACYTIDGIMTYISNDGTLKSLFDAKAILKHLNFFSNDADNEFYLFPSFFKKDRTPRIYGLGMLLYTYSKYIHNQHECKALLKYFKRYELKNKLYSRYQNENLVVTEYLIYIMYGISSFEYYNKISHNIYLHSDEKHKEKINHLFKDIILENVIKIPFSLIQDENMTVKFNTTHYFPEVSIDKRIFELNQYKAIPIKLVTTSDKIIILLRELLTNHLIFASINKKTNKITYVKPKQDKNTFYDFREAIIFKNTLVVIAYESIKGKNTILTFDLSDRLTQISKLKLPTVESTSGATYEVVPKMILLKSLDNNKLYILSGRLFGIFNGKSFTRIQSPNDIKYYLESIMTPDGIYALYLNKENRYVISNLTTNSVYYKADTGEVLFKLDYYYKKVHFRKLLSINDLKELVLYDFLHNKGNGTLYLGSNNIEGWSAWSQIYYLNGFLSFLEIAKHDIEFYNKMQELVPLVKKRLDLEIKLLLFQIESKESLKCRAFSVDRSLQTFAVQSSRFGLLLNRYLKLFPNNKDAQQVYDKLKKNITYLNDHMEVLEHGESKLVSKKWNKNNAYYLKWPKGSPFIFDGLPVPYNHQNEWATFILKTNSNKYYTDISKSIIHLFLENISEKQTGNLPYDNRWPYWGKKDEPVWWYWWGKAWEGWEKNEDISTHTPDYIGDKVVSATSFKTIDAISLLSLYNKFREPSVKKYILQMKKMIQDGYLYPYASSEMTPLNSIPLLKKEVLSKHIRFIDPWEFDNSVWSYLSFIKTHIKSKHSYNRLESSN